MRPDEARLCARSFRTARDSIARWLRRWLIRVAGGELLLVAHTSATASGSDLLPAMDEGGFILDYIMPAGSSLEETNRVITRVEEILRATPEVESTSRRTGLQLGLAAVTEANTGDISVKLKRDRKRSGEEVIADVRAKVKKAGTGRSTWNSRSSCRT